MSYRTATFIHETILFPVNFDADEYDEWLLVHGVIEK